MVVLSNGVTSVVRAAVVVASVVVVVTLRVVVSNSSGSSSSPAMYLLTEQMLIKHWQRDFWGAYCKARKLQGCRRNLTKTLCHWRSPHSRET